MRAIVISEPGGPEVLELREDVPTPVPGPDEVLVRVHASAVNRADLMQRRGRYPAPAGSPANIPGLEYAGVVEATGPGVRRWREGAAVMGIVGGGGYAEYVVVHEDEALPVPDRLSLSEAAAIPEVFLTAHDALYTQAELQAGETVLVHAAGSGVGTAAIQLAKAKGARVLGTARSAWKLERAGRLGLDVAIDASTEDFATVVERETGGHGADVVLDLVGGSVLAGNLKCAAALGRILVVGVVSGSAADLDLRTLMRKRLTLRGTVMRARSLSQKIAVAHAFEADAWRYLADGIVEPVIDRVLPMAEASTAHVLLEENRTFGKVVLDWVA